MHESYEFDLDHNLHEAIEAFAYDREVFWAGYAEDPEHLDETDDAADRVTAAAAELVQAVDRERPFSLQAARARGVAGVTQKEFRERLQILFARQIDTSTMADRCFELSGLVVVAAPGEHVRSFLARVSRTFILGLAPETIILCRSALEAALREKLPELERAGLSRLIEVARERGLVSERSASLADGVRLSANTVIHQNPLADSSVEVVRSTTEILEELYRSERGAPDNA